MSKQNSPASSAPLGKLDGSSSTSQCDAVRALLDEFVDGELSADRDTAVREHLAVCEACRLRAAHQRAFLGRLGRIEGTPAPDALRARIESALRGENG